jgi:GTP-binding protein Era
MTDTNVKDGSLATRAGFVAIVGRPNAGKSTLLNALLGTRLSIVTPRAQTTWAPVTGILTLPKAQLVLVDTPGIVLEPTQLLHRALVATVMKSVDGADSTLWVVDGSKAPGEADGEILARLKSAGRGALVVALNKCDQREGIPDPSWEGFVPTEAIRFVPISARTGAGMDQLRDTLVDSVPESPFLFPEEDLGTAPLRFFVAEMIREVILEQFRDEVPWAVLPKIEAFREGDGPNPTVIEATLFVERPSQKGILIGKQGQAIRELGSEARRRIETFLGEHVYLDLRVKVLPGWRKKVGILRGMGLTVPEEPQVTATRERGRR